MNSETTFISLYFRVAETLKRRVESKQYAHGTVIPSEKELSVEFGVSNITIRKAMALLVKEGLVIRRRGIGTQVVLREENRIPLKITGSFKDWVDSAVSRRLKLEVEILEISVLPCPASVSAILSIPAGSDIWRMKRLRKRQQEPISYYINYAPPDRLSGLTDKELKKEPFIRIFQKQCGIRIVKIEQRVEAAIADIDLAQLLQVRFGDPLFFVQNIYLSADNKPILLTHIYFRGDRYIYKGDIMLRRR